MPQLDNIRYFGQPPKNIKCVVPKTLICCVSPVLCHECPELAGGGSEEPGKVVGVEEEVAAHHQAAQPAHCLNSAAVG